MINKKVGQLLVVGLILLLGAQLTGLSCLEDFSASSVSDSAQITGVAAVSGEVAADTCPCHLAFVSILAGGYQVSHPISLIDRLVPGTAPLTPPFSLFHPPLS